MALAPSLALFGGAVEVDQDGVDGQLLGGAQAGQRVADRAVHRVDRAAHALAAVALGVAVAQLDRLVRAGRGTRWHRRAPHRAVLEQNVDLDGRIAPTVEDFACNDVDDDRHVRKLPRIPLDLRFFT